MDMSDFMWGIIVGANAVPVVYYGGRAAFNHYIVKPMKIPKDRDLVSVINLNGMVALSPQKQFSLPGMSQQQSVINRNVLKQQVQKAIDDNAKGLIIKLNTPGGYMPASDGVREYIQNINKHILNYKTKTSNKKETKKIRAEHKPLHTMIYISEIAASAGYHLASAADKICIAPKAQTGSIGVFCFFPILTKVAEKFGVEPVLIKRGKFKGAGMPFRNLDNNTKQYLEDHIETIYREFISDVADGRKLEISQVEKYAHGGILFAKDAKAAGLVDEICYDDTIVDMFSSAELGGLKNPIAKPVISNTFANLGGVMGHISNYLGNSIGRGIGQVVTKEIKQIYLREDGMPII